MYCVNCIFISTEDLAYFISIFSLVSWFVLFLAAPALRVRKAWNLMGTLVRNGQQFFILFGRKYYFIQKLKFSYYKNVFGNIFQTLGVISLIHYCMRNSDAKKYFNFRRKYFAILHFSENQVFTISALFPCFSVFSLFKLMQLICLIM